MIKFYHKKYKGKVLIFPCFIVSVYYQIILKASGSVDWVCKIPPFIMVLVMEARNMFEWWPVLGLTQTPQHTPSYSHLQSMLRVDLLRIFVPYGLQQDNWTSEKWLISNKSRSFLKDSQYLLDREAEKNPGRQASTHVVSSHVYPSPTFPSVPEISLALITSLRLDVKPGPTLVYACTWPCPRLFSCLNIYPLLQPRGLGVIAF